MGCRVARTNCAWGAGTMYMGCRDDACGMQDVVWGCGDAACMGCRAARTNCARGCRRLPYVPPRPPKNGVIWGFRGDSGLRSCPQSHRGPGPAWGCPTKVLRGRPPPAPSPGAVVVPNLLVSGQKRRGKKKNHHPTLGFFFFFPFSVVVSASKLPENGSGPSLCFRRPRCASQPTGVRVPTRWGSRSQPGGGPGPVPVSVPRCAPPGVAPRGRSPTLRPRFWGPPLAGEGVGWGCDPPW